VAIAAFGLEQGIIKETRAASILLAAVLTAFIYPALMKRIIKAIQEKKIQSEGKSPAQ
jgi:uncharacterized membrane protein required for colicin V production